MKKILLVSIYDSGVYGISVMKDGKIYHSDYSKYKIIICENGDIEKL